LIADKNDITGVAKTDNLWGAMITTTVVKIRFVANL